MSIHARSVAMVGLEALLIGLGVFLGLMGEQWREDARERDLVEASLHRFRSEITANRDAIEHVRAYHVTLKGGLDAWLAGDDEERRGMTVEWNGLRPAPFEESAWELALATQSLGDIDPELAFSLSRIYTSQRRYSSLLQGVMQALYQLPKDEGPEPVYTAATLWLSDAVVFEPQLLEMYDDVLPRLDQALGES